MPNWIIRNATYFDGENSDLVEGKDIVIEVLSKGGQALSVIMKAGQMHKLALN